MMLPTSIPSFKGRENWPLLSWRLGGPDGSPVARGRFCVVLAGQDFYQCVTFVTV
jgi:hypothetical protein